MEVTDVDGKECKVTDNQNSSFETLKTDRDGENKYRYYTYIRDLNRNYVLKVNNKETIFNNQ